MTFAAPLLLAALAALAVPVIVHLIQRERKRVVEFPSLMFLRRIPYQSVRRRHIRHWALLLLRLAALALIVAAFARPFVRRAAPPPGATGAREAVILIDRSYSMESGDRWQRARDAARAAVNRLGSGDRASIVLFDTGAEVALRSTADRAQLLAAIDAARTGPGATRYAPALKLAGSLLAESRLPRREAILISDFQKTGWSASDGVRLPGGSAFTPVDVAGREPANLAVTPVALQRARFASQERVTVSAGVINHGGTNATGVPLTLEVDGKPVDTTRLDVAAHGSASTTFAPFTVTGRNVRAAVRIPDDALRRDNVYDFVVSPADPVKVTVLDRPDGDESLYLARALGIGDAPRLDVTVRSADASGLEAAAVVVADDLDVTPALAERLARFVAAGGGLLVVAGPRLSWPQKGPDLLPGMPAESVDRSMDLAARLGALDYGHPIFDVFRAPRSGDFSTAQFYGYRALSGTPSHVLARFDNGAPALVERTGFAGRVLLWTSSIDLAWNDLALKPVFLPFVHTIVGYLADYRAPSPSLTVGQVYVVPRQVGMRRGAPPQRIAVAPSGRRVALGGEDEDVLEMAEQGFYEIRPPTAAAGAAGAVTVAANVDLRESNPERIDPKELATAVAGYPGDAASSFTARPLTPDEQAAAQRIWWYLLLAGLALLGLETVLSNRLSAGKI
ncbi:MAG TPA: BatA domain-containing protein [Vicinamibacterales bacterium]|nr:BatA domain-containing protein [Vicinamibacterales bacterium]